MSFKNDVKLQGINTPISELTDFHRSVTENDINDAQKDLRKSKFCQLIY